MSRYEGISAYEKTIIRNLFALHGLAHRWPEEPTGAPRGVADTGKARKVVRKYKLGLRSKRDDARAALHGVSFSGRWHGDKMVDFSGYYFRDPKWYEGFLRKRIQHRKGGTVGYQGVPLLGIPGQRNHKKRVKQMKLDTIDFEGKSVLDLGCNVGRWCQEAVDRGATRVVGVDDRRIGLWTQVNNWMCYWCIEFVKADLPYQWKRIREVTGQDAFDIVFCLTITPHLEGGYQPWIAKLTRELLIFEGDHRATHKTYQADMERDFGRVERMGYITDGIRAPAFRCYKDRPDDSAEAVADESEADATEGPLVLHSVESDAGADIGAEIWAERAMLKSISTAEVQPEADGLPLAASPDPGSDSDTEPVRIIWPEPAGAGHRASKRRQAGPGDGTSKAAGEAASQEAASISHHAPDWALWEPHRQTEGTRQLDR